MSASRPEIAAASVTGAVALGVVGNALRDAWAAPWPPGRVPTFDVADYVLRAHAWSSAWRAGNVGSLWELALQPDAHPALHPALLGAVLTLFPSPATESAYSFVLHVLALATLPVLGWALDRRGGALAGLLAAAITSTCLIERSMAVAPMTEPLAQWLVLLTLTAAATARRSPRSGWWWLAGVLCLGASATRYHLGPLLVVPCLAHLVAGRRAWRQTSFDAVGLLAPLLFAASATWLAAPEYLQGVRRFLVNADSGIPTLSLENLRWLTGLPERQLFGSSAVSTVALVIALSSAAAWTFVRTPALLLGVFVVLGLGAMFVHPLKVDRNVFVLIGPAALLLVLPLVRLAVGPARAFALATVAAASLAGQAYLSRGLATEQYYSSSASVGRALDAAADACARASRIVIVGAQRDLTEQVIQYALRTRRCEAEVVVQADYTPTCLTPIGPSLPACQMQEVRAALAVADTPILYVDATTGPGAKHRRWMVAQRADFTALATAAGFHPDIVELPDKGLRLSVWLK